MPVVDTPNAIDLAVTPQVGRREVVAGDLTDSVLTVAQQPREGGATAGGRRRPGSTSTANGSPWPCPSSVLAAQSRQPVGVQLVALIEQEDER